ncbi:DUF192 domain-containing protein [Emcibacter sp.]|uniref:DUF192 domain-containing protein n=1 Tax=Emcibacter sp. TaxID=1979954 RepID=UPI002AA7574C|nr:DUF192 domain-containing protein [Emcibacter sp.]
MKLAADQNMLNRDNRLRDKPLPGFRVMFLTLIFLTIQMLFCMPFPGYGQDSDAPTSLQSMVVVEGRGATHEFRTDLAITPSQRAQGLMYRESIPEDYGMLFVFDDVAPVVMWMKNTFISLDMLFVDGKGEIVHIAHSTTPLSLSRISSRYPVRGVLEIKGGKAEELDIAVGDHLVHQLFADPGSQPSP